MCVFFSPYIYFSLPYGKAHFRIACERVDPYRLLPLPPLAIQWQKGPSHTQKRGVWLGCNSHDDAWIRVCLSIAVLVPTNTCKIISRTQHFPRKNVGPALLFCRIVASPEREHWLTWMRGGSAHNNIPSRHKSISFNLARSSEVR